MNKPGFVKKWSLFVLVVIGWQFQLIAQPDRHFKMAPGLSQEDYYPDRIIVKLSRPTETTMPSGANTRRRLDMANIPSGVNILKSTSINQSISRSTRGRVRPSKYLNNMYELTLKPGANLEKEINRLLRYDNVIYAEPVYREQLLFTPNDPNATIAVQPHLQVINAYNAWDIEQGDPDISVAVIDTGTDLDHPDLVDNLLLNVDDPVNGLDDDGDGLVDNFNGYDFADGDPDPSAQNGHGVLVNGLSSASTNNGTGIAGTGFNSSFVPYKIFQSANGFSANSYAAVLFAAQHHDVMNLSWGNNVYSQASQDIINAAVLEHDAVIVAAAGNTGSEIEFYPASYENVLSVASTNLDDTKFAGSTYSYNVDLSAPGATNFTTTNGGGYGGSGPGTSFASPLVAGAAALVRARFPHWTAQQVMEQLRVSATDIYSVSGNETFFGQLGKGRLDMFNALTSTSNKSIRLVELDFSDRFGQYAFYSDTVQLSGMIKNFLSPTTDATVSISSESPYVDLMTSEISLGVMEELGSLDFSENPVELILSEDTPPEEQIVIRLDYSDGIYDDWQFIQFTTTPNYLNFATDEITLTVVGDGWLGYADPFLQQGLGFQYDAGNLATQMGLMVYSDGDVIDNAVTNFVLGTREDDFSTVKNIRFFGNSTADQYAQALLDDSDALAFEEGLFIEQKVLSWDDDPDQNYLILEYRISNKGDDDISDLKLGLFSDWEIVDDLDNEVNYDVARKLGYGFDEDGETTFAGTALLTTHSPIFYAIDRDNLNGNTDEVGISLSKVEKATFLTSGTTKTQAGLNGGNNVAQVMGAEIGALAVGESAKVAFLMGAAGDLTTLQNAVTRAQSRYAEFIDNPPVIQTDTTCFNEAATVSLTGTSYEFYSDPLAQPLDLLYTGNDLVTTPLTEDTVFYVQNIDEVYKSDIRTVRVRPLEVVPEVDSPEGIVFLGDEPNNAVQFTDQTFKAESWLWDFDNGSGSTDDNPITQFNEVGDYDVSLTVTNKFGCSAQFMQTVQVRERGEAPTFQEYSICAGESATISSELTQTLRIYDSEESETPLAEGTSFSTGPLLENRTYYVTNTDDTYESVKVPVPVVVDGLIAGFEYQPDTTDLDNKFLLQLRNTSTAAQNSTWTINGQETNQINPIIDYEGLDEITVQLEVNNEGGCTNVLTEVIALATSSTPVLNDLTVCAGEGTEIRPGGGDTFFFYSDQSLTNLLKKGTYFQTGALTTDTVFYVTNVDNLLEGPHAEISVNVLPSTVDFEMNPATLVLEDGNLVQFTDLSPGALDWAWYINQELVETSRNPRLTFNEPGDYEVALTIEDETGCQYTQTRVLQVIEVTGITSTIDNEVLLYPNPAKGQVNVHLGDLTGVARMTLLDLAGKTHLSIETTSLETELSLSGFTPGIYTLIVKRDNDVSHHRLIIQ